MRVRALLEAAQLGLRLIGGEEELDRRVHGVMVTDLSAPGRFLTGGEAVLTGLLWHHGPEDSARFVGQLAECGAAVLAAGEAEIDGIPADLVAECARHRIPLLAVPEHVAFGAIAEYVGRQVSAQRASDLAAVLDRHRALMTAPDGAGLTPVLSLLATQVGLCCRVLSPTGRQLAGPGVAPNGPGPLLEEAARDLARARLRGIAARSPADPAGGPRLRLRDGRGGVHTAFAAPGSRGAPGPLPPARWQALREWFLLVEGDAAEWNDERLQLLEELGRLVEVERDRFARAALERFRAADEALAALLEDVPPGELEVRLRAAGCALPLHGYPGGQGEGAWKVLVVTAHQNSPAVRRARPGGSAAARTGGGAGDGEGGGCAPDGELLREIVDEALPGGVVARRPDGSLVALLPHDGPAGRCTGDRVRALLDPLGAGLADAEWLAVGISHPVNSADALRGALDEAEHALGIAEAVRPGRVRVTGPEETASHVTLLAAVPDPVRRAFRDRLLGPLRAYDGRHQAGLLATLEAFLECDGSWTRCASRLNIHVNSVRYRVGRIEELTGRDLSRLADRVDLLLALRIG